MQKYVFKNCFFLNEQRTVLHFNGNLYTIKTDINEIRSMQGRVKKNILLIFIALIVIAAFAAYRLWNKPHVDVKDADAVETNAIVLYNTFITDSIKAKSDYLNKVIIVSGTVKEILLNQQNQQIILLKTSVADASVNCTMEENANNYKVGDTIRLKGICAGYIGGDIEMGLTGDVFLVRCYLST